MHRTRAEYVTIRNSISAQSCHPFGYKKCIALFHALAYIGQKFLCTAARVPIKWYRAYPNVTIANLEWEDRDIISTISKAATGGQIKSPMVPVAAQDAIFDRPLRKWITHVRAATIKRPHLPIGTQQQNMTVFNCHNFEWTLF